jgi:type IV pilus assembly protein PilM
VQGESTGEVTVEIARPVIVRAYEELLNEIKRSMEYFQTTTFHEETGQIILSGGGALLKDIPKFLAERTGIEVSIAEPFRHISPGKYDRARLEEIGPMAAVAVGLALRRPADR